MSLWSEERLNVMRFNFNSILSRCILDYRNHSRFSLTQFVHCVLTQQHDSALRDNLMMSGMGDTCGENTEQMN
jgi:hypothetical protein